MKKQKFSAELIQGHNEVTPVIVPFDPREVWGVEPVALDDRREGWLVRGTLEGVKFEGWIGFRWGRYFIIVPPGLREAAKISVGDVVDVAVEPTNSETALAIAREQAKLTTAPGRKSAASKTKATKKKASAKKAITKKKAAPRKRAPAELVREVAFSFPGVEQSTSYGTEAFKVAGKLLARFHQSEPALAIRSDFDQRDFLMRADPKTFYITDHYRNYPWILVRLATVKRAQLRSLFEAAWRSAAPKKLLNARQTSRAT